MNLRHNLLANYASQIYVTLAGVAMLPLYIQYMGVEAYGLVGFFAMLQVWFQLLDMGLTSTITWQTARFQGGAIDAVNLRRLVRAMEGIFVSVATLGAVAMLIAASAIATQWLRVEALQQTEVRNSVMLMGIIVALRWTSGLYRGLVSGFEQLVWLGCWNSIVATMRFVLVIPYFAFVGSSPTDFFSYQLAIALVELVVLIAYAYRLLPKVDANRSQQWEWQPLRRVLKFSLSVAFTSSVWVLVTQTDKLILSRLLSLPEYGYFTLAVLVASGVVLIGSPVSGAIVPRMTRLHAEGEEANLIRVYRNATQLVTVIATPLSLVLAFFAEQVLWAWTGNSLLAAKAAPVLTLYSVGNGLLAVAAFPYYLQLAKGDLRLHLIGNALFVFLLIPSLVWATLQYGAKGAGWSWVVSNAAAFFLWLPFVHRRFAKGLHLPWLVRDIGAIVFPTAVACWLMAVLVKWSENRLAAATEIVGLSVLALLVAGFGSSRVREWVEGQWRLRCAV